MVQVFGGATFGLAQGVNENGSINWSSGVNAPPIFSTAAEDLNIKGKTAYLKYSAYGTESSDENYSLQFSRLGGTYTLSGVTKNDKTQASSNLDKLSKNKSEIYSNEFWPMDSASSYGTDGDTILNLEIQVPKNLENMLESMGMEIMCQDLFRQVTIKTMIIILTLV